MNHKYILVIILFSLIHSLQGQKISSVGLAWNAVSEEDLLIVSPNAKVDVKNHNLSFGPTILISYGDQIEEREAFKLTGIYLGYENFPHGKTAKWNMFHSLDLFSQRIKDVQESQYFDLSSNSFKPNQIDQVENSFLLTSNAGVLWNVNDKLSATSMIGIGLNAVLRNTESDIEEFDDFFFEQIWMIKLGLRYNFK